MPDEFDPFDWLKEHDPISALNTASDLAEPQREVILDRLRDRPPSRRRRSRRLIPVVTVAAAVLATSGGAAVAFLVDRSRSPSPSDVLCFADADLESSRVMIDRGADPLASCASAWSDPQYGDVLDERPVPPLALCRLPSGIEAVFPVSSDGDPCQQLDLPTDADPLSGNDAAVTELSNLMAESMDHGCISVEHAAALANEAIDQVGLSGWVIEAPTATDDACASVYIDTAAAVVRIIPLPRSAPSPSD